MLHGQRHSSFCILVYIKTFQIVHLNVQRLLTKRTILSLSGADRTGGGCHGKSHTGRV